MRCVAHRRCVPPPAICEQSRALWANTMRIYIHLLIFSYLSVFEICANNHSWTLHPNPSFLSLPNLHLSLSPCCRLCPLLSCPTLPIAVVCRLQPPAYSRRGRLPHLCHQAPHATPCCRIATQVTGEEMPRLRKVKHFEFNISTFFHISLLWFQHLEREMLNP